MRELGYRAKYEAWSVGIYAANASDQAFFASAVCNTRLRERSVNMVLSVIEAWFIVLLRYCKYSPCALHRNLLSLVYTHMYGELCAGNALLCCPQQSYSMRLFIELYERQANCTICADFSFLARGSALPSSHAFL